MAVSNFPVPANSVHLSEPAGPQFLKLRELKPTYGSIVFKQMVDLGGTYGADTTNKERRFELIYDGLSFAEASILDAHNAEAVDTLLGFNFRYYRASLSIDELLSDVHYESYDDPDHGLINSTQKRTMVLVKRPA